MLPAARPTWRYYTGSYTTKNMLSDMKALLKALAKPAKQGSAKAKAFEHTLKGDFCW